MENERLGAGCSSGKQVVLWTTTKPDIGFMFISAFIRASGIFEGHLFRGYSCIQDVAYFFCNQNI